MEGSTSLLAINEEWRVEKSKKSINMEGLEINFKDQIVVSLANAFVLS